MVARMAMTGALAALLLLADPAGAATTVTGDLARRADLGFRVSGEDGRLAVTEVTEGSAAAKAGLRKGDVLAAVGGAAFARPHEGQALLQRLRGGDRTVLSVRRGDRAAEIRFTPAAAPLEEAADLDVEYGVVRTSDGAALRTILSRPAGAPGRLPALMLAQWVSCGPLDGKSASVEQLRQLARRAGMALVRVERAGSGDSLGPACHELDYDTEVRHYREALDALAAHPWIDASRLVIYGSSLGATTAPFLAEGRRVAGIMVQGGGAVTYVERMIGFDRFYLERTGVAPAEIDRRMRDGIAFHTEYLIRGKAPERIAAEHPELAGVWKTLRGTGDGVHYGRPYAWHQQAARRNFLEAWSRVEAPVLVFYGAYDQFETRHGHALIAAAVNARRPGSATLVEVAQGDHELELYPNAEDAYAYRHGQAAPELFLQPAVRWLKQVTGG